MKKMVALRICPNELGFQDFCTEYIRTLTPQSKIQLYTFFSKKISKMGLFWKLQKALV